MSELVKQHCEACRVGAPQVTAQARIEMLEQLPGWLVEIREGIPQLEKTYSFKDYQQSMEFTNRVAELAESEDHHPALLTEWGKVRVTWWTHAIGGLHRNDFICAAKTDLLG
jgi:4a-hydroxytetrahydrobiopterin dehydratase